jgi:uncharacterized membrane protein
VVTIVVALLKVDGSVVVVEFATDELTTLGGWLGTVLPASWVQAETSHITVVIMPTPNPTTSFLYLNIFFPTYI